ncbi:MAG: lysophospholipid acyltransferase family protein [Desulfobacterales bacterium]
MNAGRVDRCDHRDLPPQSQKLVDLTFGFDSGVLHRTVALIQSAVETLLHLDRVNRCYAEYHESLDVCKGPHEIFQSALTSLGVGYDLSQEDLHNIPTRGPLVVVANHPFGGLEGVILGAVLSKVRSDLRILANYLLKRVDGIGDTIIPVDPFDTPGSVKGNLRGIKTALAWLTAGGVLATFPAGEVASFRWKTGRVADPAWSPHVAAIARRTRAAVLPVFFPGRNSLFFQLLGVLHPRLRTALLPRELMNKNGRCVRVFVGKAIPWQVLKRYETDAELIEFLRLRTHFLKNRGVDKNRHRLRLVSLKPDSLPPQPIMAPVAAAALHADLAGLPQAQQLISSGDFAVYMARASQIPNILNEIGRLREITFRDACEGTGKPVDLDRFDAYYRHLFLWNHASGELVGAYRLGLSDAIMRVYGVQGLYTNQLFRYKPALLEQLNRSVEFGRSFIRPEYQKKFNSLMLLWKGIGAFIAHNPHYNILFGPVSISKDYHTVSRNLIVRFLQTKRFDDTLARFVSPRKPFRTREFQGSTRRLLHTAVSDLDDISLLISEIERDGKGIPVLLRQYLKLNGSLISFNLDREFSDVVDGLLMVDLRKTDPRLLKRFMGEEGVRQFTAVHGPLADPADEATGHHSKRTGQEAA